MKIKNLNYCREMVKQFNEWALIPSIPREQKQFHSHCIDLAHASQKFILPDGGRLYDDPEYRALDESEPISLPFPLIAIEFTRSKEYTGNNKHIESGYQPRKSLLFARQREDAIAITIIVWAEHVGLWVPYPEIGLPRTNYLDRTQKLNGYVAIKGNRSNEVIPFSDYSDEVGALLCMLNILQCKNVHIDQSEASKTRKAMNAGKKAALPFDSYHILTIDIPVSSGDGHLTGGHRSPREHLRRGHIRHLADSRRIWVNATVVAAGRGAGVVTKDYAIRCSA